jgi:hypothetical protein
MDPSLPSAPVRSSEFHSHSSRPVANLLRLKRPGSESPRQGGAVKPFCRQLVCTTLGRIVPSTDHPGNESFDGEIAWFLVYERPLADLELKRVLDDLQ